MRCLILSLVLLVVGSSQAQAHDFNWKNLLMASLKLREGLDLEANVDSYMQVFRPDVWKRYHNDEFELRAKRKETMALMASTIERFPLDEAFVLRTTTTFGTYDFDKQEYPLAGWNETSYFYEYGYPHGDFPSNIRVFFKNPQALKAVPMAEDAAREFLKLRKDRYGNVNRQLNVVLYVRVIEVKTPPADLLAEIQGGRIYADKNNTQLIHEFSVRSSETKE